ncbi:MAG: serine/threonine protein kinase [Myxococcales bacterium]|nr:serine/threonine protein kinase [Myxococcales bacterium]
MSGAPTLPSGSGAATTSDGVVLDRYRLLAPLGAGGMGTVWRAHDPRLGRDVAIKLVTLGDGLARARFLREGKLAARLDHRGLCKVFDVGQEGDRGCLVMELLAGRTLFREALEPIAPARALAITVEVARAMAHAHAAGLIHRDLKPDNVFLDRRGDDERAVVIDFGLAFAIDGDPGVGRLTSADVTGGTPAYMSPEQARAATLTAASDVYALGCVLFELLTGAPPFDGAAALVMSKHVYAAPPALATVAPALPPALAALVARMLHKTAGERPTMREVADACERIGQAMAGVPWQAALGLGLGLGRGQLREDRANRMVTRTETTQAGPVEAAHGTVAIVGALGDELMVALAAIGVASTRAALAPPPAADLLVIDGDDAAVAQAVALGRPVIAAVDAGDIEASLRLARLGAADVVTRPIAPDVAARKIERRLRRAKPGSP